MSAHNLCGIHPESKLYLQQNAVVYDNLFLVEGFICFRNNRFFDDKIVFEPVVDYLDS